MASYDNEDQILLEEANVDADDDGDDADIGANDNNEDQLLPEEAVLSREAARLLPDTTAII